MTDGRYPDGDHPYGRGVADEVYGTGEHAAHQAYGTYDTGANAAYGTTAYDSGAWQTGGYAPAAYPQGSYPDSPQTGYDTSGYETAYGHETPSYGGIPAYDASGAYGTVDNSGGYPVYTSGAYPAAYDTDGGYGQAASASPQTGYETAPWSGDVMTAVQEQPTAWAAEPWTADGTSTAWSSTPAADMWADGDNRLGTEAFAEPHRNDGTATGWYDTSYGATEVQDPAQGYDGHAAAWQEPVAWHDSDHSGETAAVYSDGVEGVDPFAGTQEFAAVFTSRRDDADEYADGYEYTGHGTADDGGEDHSAEATDNVARASDNDGYDRGDADEATTMLEAVKASGDEDEPEPRERATAVAARAVPAAEGRRAARRKTTRRTRPLVKVAGGSIGVLGAAAMAVAAAGGIQAADNQGASGDNTVASGADVPLTSPLDQQFTDLRTSAEDFADRAGRAQTRVALEERQEETARQQAAIAAQQEQDRKNRELLRPKYALPVAPGLSAYFGQAGGRWSSLHTGIDFPVKMGTPVHAVTDGVVRTEWNRSYGNMVIVTAPDGTETWYCHLTRAKVVSGPVKAGDVIAYSGNSGNSTGPHLHLEVRPGGGAPINPIPWLRARNLDPT